MVMDPHNPDVVYIAGGKTIDGGRHWFATAIGGVTMGMDPNNPNIVYAWGSPSGGISKTTDGGQTFFPAYKGLGVGAVFALTIDAKNSSVLYAGTQGGGAYKSIYGAASWRRVKIDPTVGALLSIRTTAILSMPVPMGTGSLRAPRPGQASCAAAHPRWV